MAQALAVGDFQVEGKPNFDLVSDDARGVLHLVYQTGATKPHIEHRTSTDGRTWSDATLLPGEGRSPRAAVDSKGTLHVVFGRKLPGIKGDDIENRVWHTSRDARPGSTFGDPFEIKAPASQDPQSVSGARLAIDGRDNVHVIAWKLIFSETPGGEEDNWKNLQRCIYTRKPAGAGQSFEAVVELLHDGVNGSGHGDIARAPDGDVHIVYNAWDRNGWDKRRTGHRWRAVHVVRTQDGDWMPETHNWRSLGGDFGISIAVDGRGVVHATGLDFETGPEARPDLRWCYFNNADRPDEMKPKWCAEDHENITTAILLRPSGDVWLTRASNSDRLARYVSYDASRKVWSEPQTTSPPGRRNVEHRWNQMPKLASFRGATRLVFAEKLGHQSHFQFRQRILGP